MADWQFMQVHRSRGQSLGSVWHLRFEIFWEAQKVQDWVEDFSAERVVFAPCTILIPSCGLGIYEAFVMQIGNLISDVGAILLRPS